ncbi:uncharacterized protein TNIN_309901 [Trichonephila inaurata madagascariensis]|uniref:Uncharacterized protein n=1 Tax=Trichonephila inaurata madagascariensis TaxID=2747483 RepID=A0A8X6YP74_9ARAC|nr:uncharacterized protein TNIN_309901 [Trichonephila inaurata madagascariensis]
MTPRSDDGNCHNHRLFPTEEFLQKNPEVDRTILDYTRTETAFAIITFCLIVMGFGFGLYTFKEPRYMFKRLAGGVHFIGAAAVLVVIEVVVNSVEYEEQYLTDRHPKGAVWSYGYSFVFAWLTFVVMLIIGITFMICSRKKKGDRSGGGQVDDEPHILGRIEGKLYRPLVLFEKGFLHLRSDKSARLPPPSVGRNAQTCNFANVIHSTKRYPEIKINNRFQGYFVI